MCVSSLLREAQEEPNRRCEFSGAPQLWENYHCLRTNRRGAAHRHRTREWCADVAGFNARRPQV